jgi:tRNA 2-thiouridine synthesizing protein A
MADKVLDAKGLNCPLPILKAKKALKDVPDGGTLEILATDPGAVADFQAFSRTTGNELVEHSGDCRPSLTFYRFDIRTARSSWLPAPTDAS